MLGFFRINDPYRLIGLLVLLTLASLPFLINLPSPTTQELKGMVLGEQIGDKLLYVQIIDHTAPLMAVVEGVLDFLFGRSVMLRHLLALLVVFFQASFFSILLINNKAYNETNYVPALIFAFLCCFSFDVMAITPELLASTLLLFALNNLFKEIEFRVERDSIVVNLGLYVGLASLFVFSYSIFLIGAIVLLTVYARATLRKILLMLFGYGLVHSALFTIYYWFERTGDLWTHFYAANLDLGSDSLVSWKSMLILAGVPIAYFVFSLFMLTREARFTKYQSQLFQVIFWWMATAILQIALTHERTPHSFVTFIPPAAYFISHYLLLIRRRWIAETMTFLFVAGLLAVNLLAYQNHLTDVNYKGLFPVTSANASIQNKKIMIIGDDLSLYRNNTMAGYFLDWNLSRKYFEEPDYYENLVRIHGALTEDPPDAIIDEKNLMKPVFERIPRLQAIYRKEGAVYWKR